MTPERLNRVTITVAGRPVVISNEREELLERLEKTQTAASLITKIRGAGTSSEIESDDEELELLETWTRAALKIASSPAKQQGGRDGSRSLSGST